MQRFRHTLASQVANFNHTPTYVVAYSGGVDSHVLLHLCASCQLPVRAIHIHHGLQTQADDWDKHCQSVCDALGVSLQTIRVDASAKRGDSPEAAAREARYAALNAALETGEVLLLGQHKNDQAETVLLQMFRGAGAAGLSAMPQQSRIQNGNTMLRLLLDVSRQQIEGYAVEHGLQWIEDPSNQDVQYRRNALRQNILPQIEAVWPDAVNQLTQVAEQQQHSRELIDDLARADLAAVIAQTPGQLVLSSLQRLSRSRQFNTLRYWLHTQQTRPNKNCIQQIIETVLYADDDAVPVVSWSDFEVRRFDGALYLLTASDTAAVTDKLAWQPQQVLVIEKLAAKLSAESDISSGLASSLLDKELVVRFRSGGEQIQRQGSSHHQALKKLFQQVAIPPWQRQRIPLIYCDDELIAVCGYWLSAKHCVAEVEKGWRPRLSFHP